VVLAITAYATVLQVGFLADDFPPLNRARVEGLTPHILMPGPDPTFYRPVGDLLIFRLGWLAWGFNAWPYHLTGLLLHAGVALALALSLYEVTRSRSLGLLAGALFAVFPLNLEPVAWIGAQWDVLAALFGLLGLWLFTRWWRADQSLSYCNTYANWGLLKAGRPSV